MAPMEVIPVTEQNLGSAFLELGARSFLQMSLHRALAVGHFFAPSGIWLVCFGRAAVSAPGLGLNAIQSLWLTGKESMEAGPDAAPWAMPWPVRTA